MSRGYPTMEQVEAAGQGALMSWSRFLPSPTDENRPVLDRILARQAELREENPGGYVAASKSAGW